MGSERVVILGASRGLGAELAQVLIGAGHQVLGVARKLDLLHQLEKNLGPRFEAYGMDLSHEEAWGPFQEVLLQFRPQRFFYVAGGGPHGSFAERPFHAHQWAWKVSFEGGARVCHWALRQTPLPQMVLIGSSVCEEKADPLAASYAAAKHAVKGLYDSLRAEAPSWDLRLFSPGYLDTELLPKGAPIRYKTLWQPSEVAARLAAWAFDQNQHGAHEVCPDTPL